MKSTRAGFLAAMVLLVGSFLLSQPATAQEEVTWFINANDRHVLFLSLIDGSWGANDPSLSTYAPSANFGSSLAGFVIAGRKHVFWVSPDGHLQEEYYNGAWGNGDIGAIPTFGSRLISFTVGDSEHVFYVLDNRHIGEAWWAGSGWNFNIPTAAPGAPPVATTWTALTGFTASDLVEHVYYIAGDQHIHEVYWNGSWHHFDPMAAAGAPPAAAGSELTSFAYGDTLGVYYIATDQHIHELFWNGGSNWYNTDLMVVAGAPPPVGGSALTGLVGPNFVKHVYYVAGDQHIHELYWDGSWHPFDPMAVAGGPPPVAGGDLSSFVSIPLFSSIKVYYMDGIGHIHQLSWFGGTTWYNTDATDAALGPQAAPPDPFTGRSPLKAYLY